MFKKKTQSSTSSAGRSRHLPLSDILRATNNFDKSLVIGKGAFGVVYKGEVFDGKTHVPVAIKRLKGVAMEGVQASWLTDLEKLTFLRHSNLVSLIGYCVKEVKKKSMSKGLPACLKEVILVYEYVPNGTLKDHLHIGGAPLAWIQRLNICTDVGRALHFLHTQTGTEVDATLMHGDIKSSNILLTESWAAKISDFGLSKIGPTFEPSDSPVTLSKGSFGYLDYFSLDCGCGRLTRKSDVYSFGVLLLEMLCRKPVIDVHNGKGRSLSAHVTDSVKNGSLEDVIDPVLMSEVSSKCLMEFYKIAHSCLNSLPEQRPQMADLVNRLESLVLHDPRNRKGRFPDVPRPSVKEFTFDVLEKATGGFSRPLTPMHGLDFVDVFLGWIEQNTLAPSEEGVGIAVAVKRITSEAPDKWLEDLDVLARFEHPNVIKLMGYCNKDEHEHLLIYEHLNRSLSQVIHWDEPRLWKERLQIMKGVASGLKYLYTTEGVVCRFQCGDILLDERFNAKIGGFGWTAVHEIHGGKRLNGSFGYRTKHDYDTNTGPLSTMDDIFSFGLVLLEVITGRHLSDFKDVFAGLNSLGMQDPKSKLNRRKLKKMIDPCLKGGYSREGAFKCVALASRCTVIEPEYRPSRAEILWSLEQTLALHK